MKLSRSLAIALFFTLSNGAGGSAQTQGDFTLARGRVGALRIGMTADEVVASFGRQRVKRVDVYLEDPTPTPALEIRFGSPSALQPSLTAELSDEKVYRVRVFDRRFKTADSLGIGSTLAQIRARHGVKIGVGEGSVWAISDELQLSFDFSQFYPSVNVPPSGRAQSVLVFLTPTSVVPR